MDENTQNFSLIVSNFINEIKKLERKVKVLREALDKILIVGSCVNSNPDKNCHIIARAALKEAEEIK